MCPQAWAAPSLVRHRCSLHACARSHRLCLPDVSVGIDAYRCMHVRVVIGLDSINGKLPEVSVCVPRPQPYMVYCACVQ